MNETVSVTSMDDAGEPDTLRMSTKPDVALTDRTVTVFTLTAAIATPHTEYPSGAAYPSSAAVTRLDVFAAKLLTVYWN